jgi:hypothetical protein
VLQSQLYLFTPTPVVTSANIITKMELTAGGTKNDLIKADRYKRLKFTS